MKTKENPKQNNLLYQKQLYNTLKLISDFRTQLLTEGAILANDAKSKEWPSPISKVKLLRKQIEKTNDENLRVVSTLLKDIEQPILQLEQNLELKNSFRELIEEQSLLEKQEPATI
jgi:hypothetical protein